MSNLTLAIDDKVLKNARIRALKEGTSVNEICRKAIEAYARASNQDRLERYLKLQAEIEATPRTEPVLPAPWKNRDEMYEQMFAERSPMDYSVRPVKPSPKRKS